MIDKINNKTSLATVNLTKVKTEGIILSGLSLIKNEKSNLATAV